MWYKLRIEFVGVYLDSGPDTKAGAVTRWTATSLPFQVQVGGPRFFAVGLEGEVTSAEYGHRYSGVAYQGGYTCEVTWTHRLVLPQAVQVKVRRVPEGRKRLFFVRLLVPDLERFETKGEERASCAKPGSTSSNTQSVDCRGVAATLTKPRGCLLLGAPRLDRSFGVTLTEEEIAQELWFPWVEDEKRFSARRRTGKTDSAPGPPLTSRYFQYRYEFFVLRCQRQTLPAVMRPSGCRF
jgi:hypothetical protein